MEVEGGDAFEPAASVEAVRLDERLKWGRALDPGGANAPAVFHRNSKPFHERASVFAKSLLPRDKRVAVVRVLHGALFQVVGEANVVVRTDDDAGSFTLEEVADRFDLLGRGLLFSDHVIEAVDHERVGIVQNALVEGKLLSGRVDALI